MAGFPARFGRFLVSFGRDDCGATAIEYALIASGIFLAIVLAVSNMASSVKLMFDNISSNLNKFI